MCLINDGIEDTEHFLLQCYAYDDQRRSLPGTINKAFRLHNILNLSDETLVQIMLYGDNLPIRALLVVPAVLTSSSSSSSSGSVLCFPRVG